MDYYRILGIDIDGSSLYVCNINNNYFMFIEKVTFVHKVSEQGVSYVDAEDVKRSPLKPIDQSLFHTLIAMNTDTPLSNAIASQNREVNNGKIRTD